MGCLLSSLVSTVSIVDSSAAQASSLPEGEQQERRPDLEREILGARLPEGKPKGERFDLELGQPGHSHGSAPCPCCGN